MTRSIVRAHGDSNTDTPWGGRMTRPPHERGLNPPESVTHPRSVTGLAMGLATGLVKTMATPRGWPTVKGSAMVRPRG